MIFKSWFGVILFFLAAHGFAHDEGHGPKLNDPAKYGGLVAPIVDFKDVKKGAHADVVYKAELVLSSDGKVRLYVYDQAMKPLDLATFEKGIKGILATSIKGKHKEEAFSLILDGRAFVGQIPKPVGKPFDLDFHLTQGQRKLLTAFDNLD